MDHLPEIPVGGRYSNGRYDLRFIKKLVSELEQGTPLHVMRTLYKVDKGSLMNWVARYGSGLYVARKKQLTPVADKIAVAQAIAAGKLTFREAAVANSVDVVTIRSWHKEYAGENNELSFYNPPALSKKQTKKQPISDSEQLIQLQKQLADAQLKITALNTLIDVAEQQLKINIRKKPGARQS